MTNQVLIDYLMTLPKDSKVVFEGHIELSFGQEFEIYHNKKSNEVTFVYLEKGIKLKADKVINLINKLVNECEDPSKATVYIAPPDDDSESGRIIEGGYCNKDSNEIVLY